MLAVNAKTGKRYRIKFPYFSERFSLRRYSDVETDEVVVYVAGDNLSEEIIEFDEQDALELDDICRKMKAGELEMSAMEAHLAYAFDVATTPVRVRQ